MSAASDKTGGYEPMYPVTDCSHFQYAGISKREAFAMAAMQGLLASPFDQTFQPATTLTYEDFAIDCVKYADALLTELDKSQ